MTLWVVLMRAYMLESKWSFLSALFLLAFSPVFLQLDIITIAEKASAWAFILLVTGILQALLERNDTRKSNK
jgi:predicted permease